MRLSRNLVGIGLIPKVGVSSKFIWRKKFYRTAIISKLSTRTEGRRTRNNVSDFIRQRYEIRRTKKGSLHMKASLI